MKKLRTAFNKQWPGMKHDAVDTLRRYAPNVEFTMVESKTGQGIFFATTSETLPRLLSKHPLARVDEISSQDEYERAIAYMARPKPATPAPRFFP
jgi:hypothetical protein